MIIGNNKLIRIIGYPQSSMTQEFVNEITKTHTAEVVVPQDFVPDPEYQYIVAVTFDLAERKQIIDAVDQHNLDLVTVVHDTCLVGTNPPAKIGAGNFVFPFTTVALGSQTGRHCIIGPYNLIGHYSQLGDNCITRPGVTISDKSTVGDNCVFNIKSTVTNKVTITDNVAIMGLSNVVKDIEQSGRYAGSSARRVGDF
jgi:carbonic anhydrase/acetyltransferase-like protein (isoleucine patch superfamily)